MAKIIVLGAMKGGVGKSVSTYNLAYSLKKLGKNVLVVDFDSSANITRCVVEDIKTVEISIGDLMMNQMDEEEQPNPAEYIINRNGVDFIPSSKVLSAVDAKLRLEMGAEKILACILEPLREAYDYILIDTCPSLNTLTINALAAADEVIIVADMQFWAMTGLEDFLLTVKKMEDLEEARGLVRNGDYEALSMLYDSVPEVLSELIRTAFVAREGYKFVVSDFSAIEARVLSWLAGEKWRTEVFGNNGDICCASASAMFGVPVEKHGENAHLRQKGKIAELALGYGGSVGALKSMGALEMGIAEEELQPLVDMWRQSNPNIVRFWWDVDRAVKNVVKNRTQEEVKGIRFYYQSGMLFIKLPSGRQLSYVKPRMGENQFGGEAVTYEGVGGTKKWERIESYGPKFVENIVQAISRDILSFAMQTLSHCFICGHVHDELIIECSKDVSLNVICEQMGRAPSWAKGLVMRADGYETEFYKKD